MRGSPATGLLRAQATERVMSWGIGLFVLALLLWGYAHRDDGLVDPERGLGYALGVVGGTLMLILLAYPLRKRKPRLKAIGSVGFWFRTHMLLGLAGPLAILYHCRFGLGSLNSNIALVAMLVVAGSGLVGRFLYSRVHRGYSDRKLELRGLKTDMDALIGELAAAGVDRERVTGQLQPFEDQAIRAGQAFWSSARAVVVLGISTRLAQGRLHRRLTAGTPELRQRMGEDVAEFFRAVRRAAEFAFYDRLLRLWHLLHLPLFILLVAAAILHVVAVHKY